MTLARAHKWPRAAQKNHRTETPREDCTCSASRSTGPPSASAHCSRRALLRRSGGVAVTVVVVPFLAQPVGAQVQLPSAARLFQPDQDAPSVPVNSAFVELVRPR